MANLTPGQKLRQVLGIGVMADNRHGRDRPRLHPGLVGVMVVIVITGFLVLAGAFRG